MNVGDKTQAVWGQRRRATAYGTQSITLDSGNTPKSADILFGFTFATPPVVQTTPITTSPQSNQTSASDITTTGCKIWLNRANTTAVTVQWIAVGEDGL